MSKYNKSKLIAIKFCKAQILIIGQFRKILNYRCSENYKSFGIRKKENHSLGIKHQKVCIYSKTGHNKGDRTMIIRGGVGKETKLLNSDI